MKYTIATVLMMIVPLASLLLAVSCAKPNEVPGTKNSVQQQAPGIQPQPKTAVQPPVKDPIESITSLDELTSIVEGTPNTLLVFDLYADWCRPCRMLAPTFSALAGTHSKNARFFRIDVQRNPDIASAFRVNGIPLVVFMKDKEVVHALSGLNPRENYERVITACGPLVPAEECRMKLSGSL